MSYPKDCRYCSYIAHPSVGYHEFHKYDAYCIKELQPSSIMSRLKEQSANTVQAEEGKDE